MDIEAGERARWARCAGLDRNESARRDVGLHETSFWCCGSLLSNGRASALHTFHRSPSSVWCAKFPFLQRFPQIWWQTFHSRNPVLGSTPPAAAAKGTRCFSQRSSSRANSVVRRSATRNTTAPNRKSRWRAPESGRRRVVSPPTTYCPANRGYGEIASHGVRSEVCGGWPRQEPPGLDGTRGPPGRASGGAQRLLPISGRQTQLTLTHAVD